MPFDRQPSLEGETLELRPLRPGDFDSLFTVASDPLLWEQHPARDRHEPEVFRGFFDDQLASGGGLLVLDRRSGEVVGTSRYHGYDAKAREVEIGWTFVARSRWGDGTNAELKRLMLEHAFRSVDTVVFVVHPENIRSRRAVEKLGAERIDDRGGNVAYALRRGV